MALTWPSTLPGPQGGVIAADACGSGSVQLDIPAGLPSAPSSSLPVYVDPSYSIGSTELAAAMVTSATPCATPEHRRVMDPRHDDPEPRQQRGQS
jgi:hypothetical protein